MTTLTAPYREVIERLPTDSTLILRGISWAEYEELTEAVGEAPSLRISYTQSYQFALYLQDNWRVNDKLTLNLGLRYDLDTPRTERYNRMSYVDPDAASPLKVPEFPNLKGVLGFVDSNTPTTTVVTTTTLDHGLVLHTG